MLGKGLEALIPPQDDGLPAQAGQNGDGGQSTPQEPYVVPQNLSGRHDHDEPAPQILSFEFTQPSFSDENLGGQAQPEEIATPAVAAYSAEATSAAKAGKAMADKPAVANLPAQAGAMAGKPAVVSGAVEERTGVEVYSPRENMAREIFDRKTESQPVDHIYHIEVSKISPNPNQPRKNFNEESLRELAKSIREFGFLQPLVVTRKEVETTGGLDVAYELIAGERRLLAAKILGLEHVPAIVRNVDLEREKLELAIIENLQREDLNPVEKARAFQRLQEEFRLTQREIASKLGKSREAVANTVRLLDLPVYIQEALEKGQLSESHGRFLLAIGDPAAQKKLFDDILTQGLTTRDLKQRVRSSKPKEESGEERSPEIKMLEEKLTMELGTPVKIEKGVNNGKITITFYSDEELQNIVGRFGGGEG